MKKNILFLISFLFILISTAQEKKAFEYELVGALVLDSKQLFSYKIEFNARKNNFIEGYSYTDLGGENETKSYIRGYYDADSKKIQFKESDILYTKSKFLPEEFCFIKFEGVFKGKSKKKSLKGDFIGIYDDKDTCATGQVKLVSTKFLEKKVKKFYKKVKKVDKIKKIDSIVKEELKPENYLKKFSETKIASGEKVSVFVYTSKMKMEIWDYGKEDGDKITILLNDVEVLKNFSVTKKKKSIILDLKEDKNLIKIITVDGGSIKTNTTKLKLYDFRRQYEVIADLEEGKSASINVVKLKVTNKKQ
ncbi:hypothetical protein JL193_15975 [Polaribacter batillariae]|uniref:Uncharacterized protein n=1 Tax=Polaribacter batillariae TaxID=2808900 RepID=A0ABX7STI6_9FLAO|nr:hypothetical protein [Polaribacter batillariae]QTD37550.1 hypothetical protein JL193_15975 [Polaribacter batillariae]